MPRPRSTETAPAPPPSDDLKEDLDKLAANIIAECLGPDSVPIDTKIDALKTTGSYWNITRKGAGPEMVAESAYRKYRGQVNGTAH